jgi:hypothetical protein
VQVVSRRTSWQRRRGKRFVSAPLNARTPAARADRHRALAGTKTELPPSFRASNLRRNFAILSAIESALGARKGALDRGVPMAARPSWEGHLRLSLVTCPVALYPATSEAETVRFNLINPATGNRIKGGSRRVTICHADSSKAMAHLLHMHHSLGARFVPSQAHGPSRSCIEVLATGTGTSAQRCVSERHARQSVTKTSISPSAWPSSA